MSWMRYPGRLAHLTRDGSAKPIAEASTNVGTIWRTYCGRELRVFWNERPWQAEWVNPVDLRAENPRGWCLRCAFWAALDALILPTWSFSDFVARVQTGHWELVPCSAVMSRPGVPSGPVQTTEYPGGPGQPSGSARNVGAGR